jgi:hypothetical protein
MGLSFSPNEKSDLILTIYGKLALWAAITIFPAECLSQGEEGQVQIKRGFVRNFAECIDPRSDNAAAAITFINNAFSFGGLKDCYRIVVRRDNLSKAQEALGIAPFNENFDGQD